jgi:hypothetical protein
MKRILLILQVIFFLHTSVKAQFKKGDLLLGGNLSYSSNSNNSTTPPFPGAAYRSGYFTISAGTALSANAVMGLNLAYTPGSFVRADINGTAVRDVNHAYSTGIFYRLYKSLGKEFYLFAEGDANYNWSDSYEKDASGNKTVTGSTNGVIVEIFPGIAYIISKKFFIEITIPNLFSMGYVSSKTILANVETTQSQFSIGANLSSNSLGNLGVGFKLVL